MYCDIMEWDHVTGHLPLQGHGASMCSPGRPWEAHFQPSNMSWLMRSWTSGRLNLWTCSPETQTNMQLRNYSLCTTAVWESMKTEKEEKNKIMNSQSFCASPPSCFSHWTSRCRTCRKDSSSCPARMQKAKKTNRIRVERAWLESHTVTRSYQLINNSIMCTSIHTHIQ